MVTPHFWVMFAVVPLATSRSLTVATTPTTIKGYFRSWKDTALFALFIVFTLKACARICVSGLLFGSETRRPLPSPSTSASPLDDDGWAVAQRPPPLHANPAALVVAYTRWLFVSPVLHETLLAPTDEELGKVSCILARALASWLVLLLMPPQLLGSVVISQGGVVPHIDPSLLPARRVRLTPI
ncbi:hypothetical protein GGX14DRAFT_667367 [Mycena pura]|uniref:Histone H2A C-terminal domain-containing protein n=1 Tax=Mycena pura TaxID=153505 RepID=A0AAD6V1Y5_9AGAR|nr:hypothetical protein GGX14DRAFT_667367 [Mycena pura]